jgi:hypothetical protein
VAPRPSILIDTNIIIEARRVGALDKLRSRGGLVTVERCRDEALSGIPGTRGRIDIAPDDLGDPLSVVGVSQADRVHVALLHPESSILDDGERDLLVYAFKLPRAATSAASTGVADALRKAGLPVSNPFELFSLITADRAAVRVAMSMGLEDHLVSLEDVLETAGIRVNGNLKGHYTTATLGGWKTAYRLGM